MRKAPPCHRWLSEPDLSHIEPGRSHSECHRWDSESQHLTFRAPSAKLHALHIELRVPSMALGEPSTALQSPTPHIPSPIVGALRLAHGARKAIDGAWRPMSSHLPGPMGCFTFNIGWDGRGAGGVLVGCPRNSSSRRRWHCSRSWPASCCRAADTDGSPVAWVPSRSHRSPFSPAAMRWAPSLRHGWWDRPAMRSGYVRLGGRLYVHRRDAVFLPVLPHQ